MTSALFIGFVAAALAGAALLVLALWRHKRGSAADVKLIGELGRVATTLDPEGTVIIAGELWRAKSDDETSIAVSARVRVVRMQGHLVVVEPCPAR